MRNPIAEYFNDPDFGRTRRTAGLAAVMAVAVVSVAVIAYARQRKSSAVGQPLPTGAGNALRACICPKDGTPHAWQPGIECEKMRCSRCGGPVESGLYVPGGAGKTGTVYPRSSTTGQTAEPRAMPTDRTASPILTGPQPIAEAPQPEPQTFRPEPVPPLLPLAPQSNLQQLFPLAGFVDPPDVPLAEDGLPWWGRVAQGALATFPATQPYWATQPTATTRRSMGTDNAWNPGLAFTPQRPGASALCVCPSCGTRVPNDGHLYCPAVPCPRCSRAMMPGVPVGVGQAAPPATTAGPGAAPPAVGPAPTWQGSAPGQAGPGTLVATAVPPSYTTSVAPIVQRNCLRCHGGPMRNLASYDNLRSYATGGLLMMMIQPGGPMSHFLTPSEAQTVIDWIQAGEPR